MDLTGFVEEFRAEAAEHLRFLNAQLLTLERGPSDVRPIRDMFLAAHTIKGGAAMLNLGDVRVLAHAMEDVLAYLRDQHQPLDANTADLLFRALDALRDLLEASSPGAEPDPPTAAMAAALRERAGIKAGPSPAQSVEAASPPRARCVLLVEDSPTVRLLESMLLSEAGFQVDAVADGDEALTRALTSRYELVISGVETRGLRGPELAAALYASPAGRGIPVILTSCDGEAESRSDPGEPGVDARVQKGSRSQHGLVETALALVERET